MAQRRVCIINDEPNDAEFAAISDRKGAYVYAVFREYFRRACKPARFILGKKRDLLQQFVCDHSHYDLVSLNMSQVDDLLRLSR